LDATIIGTIINIVVLLGGVAGIGYRIGRIESKFDTFTLWQQHLANEADEIGKDVECLKEFRASALARMKAHGINGDH
jgi:hypothetical protein